jgi:hypothetical protein
MKNMLLIAVGVWIGREIYMRLAQKQAKGRDLKIQKQLQRFMQDQLPVLTPEETTTYIIQILK